jgi:predicted RND superfamily exporter protein
VIRGPILIPIILVIVAITVAAFFLNAVFALAVARPGEPDIRAARDDAWRRRWPIFLAGAVMGLAVGFATMVVTRWGRPWFGIVLSIVVGLMTLCYVLVPARLIGGKPHYSRRDKLMTTTLGGVLSATVSAPPYLLGRVGLLMLGSKVLLIPAILVLAVAATLQAGATGAVRAITMCVTLVGPRPTADPADSEAPAATAQEG